MAWSHNDTLNLIFLLSRMYDSEFLLNELTVEKIVARVIIISIHRLVHAGN